VISQKAIDGAVARSVKRSEALLAARNQRTAHSGTARSAWDQQTPGTGSIGLQRGVRSGVGSTAEEGMAPGGRVHSQRDGEGYVGWSEKNPGKAGFALDSRLEEEIGRLGLGGTSPGKHGGRGMTRSRSNPLASSQGASGSIMFQLESFVTSTSVSPRAEQPASAGPTALVRHPNFPGTPQFDGRKFGHRCPASDFGTQCGY
jgi:hypothetical protein